MMNLKYLCYLLSLLTHGSISQKYIGCYNDEGPIAAGGGGRAMTSVSSDGTFLGCIQACSAYNYFALQNGLSCWCGNDLSQITRYGEYDGHGWNAYARSNCYTLQSNTVGGAYTNAVYEYTAAPTPSPTPFTGCNNKGNKDRLLGIRTNAVNQWAGSGSKLFANIYSNGGWDGWRALDNPSCSDFQKGSVDYFDDFEDITSEWEGISLYHCGNDGLLIETLYYWDGTEQKTMNMWYSSVFGPFNQHCLYNDNSKASSTNPLFAYSDIWIKGTDCGCEGVTFRTVGYDGRVWTGTGPGKPNCGASEYGEAPVIPENIPKPSKYAPYINTSSDFEEKLVDYLMTVIGIAALLFVSNSCLITVLVKKRLSNPQYEYGKVYKTDME